MIASKRRMERGMGQIHLCTHIYTDTSCAHTTYMCTSMHAYEVQVYTGDHVYVCELRAEVHMSVFLDLPPSETVSY